LGAAAVVLFAKVPDGETLDPLCLHQ
jgi:hypothetical protein